MMPQSAIDKDITAKHQAELRENKRRRENAKKAKRAANELFPGEKWKQIEDGIYLSPGRKTGKESNYEDELRDAQIFKSFGSTVYLVPESRSLPGKKYDAIVNGVKMEFKNMHGSSISTLQEHFFVSRSQAPNVFINLEKSDLTKQDIITALYGARNNTERYTRKNKFAGGRIILKIRGMERLVYLDVDKLKIRRK